MPRVITPLIIADFRKRLCDVASELLAEQGMDGFNMRELAKRLRVSPMTAYRYFKDKNEILGHLRARGFARLADMLEEAHAQSSTAEEAAAAMVRAYLQFAAEEQVSYRLMFDLFQPAGEDVPELLRHQRRVRAVMNDLAAPLVQEGLITGEPDTIGQVLWSALHGIVALRLTTPVDQATFERVAAEALRLFAGLRADPKPTVASGWQAREGTPTPPAVLSAAE